ncbi:MAG: carboxypeptidase regulatory-like domain-containing protein [Acidobacteria bacterium]|nr:carboxypeptidase regulatory-like domain-containing protein [Acidobacteriota bacterium]
MKRKGFGWMVCLALAVMLGAAPGLRAQILYGSLTGNVKDASEAAVSNATVTITSVETNQSRQTVTNEVGGYSFPTVQAGTYTLRVTKEGFSAFSESNVVVTINTVTRVDVALRVGAVTETVTVTGEVAMLQTDRSEVRAEINSATFQNLPVAIGRNYQQLFRMLPGFRPPSNAHSVPTNPSRALTFNVNGASYSINNTRIDGASSNAPWLPHITSFVPTLEAIDAVNVVTNSFDAEQGLAGGAAINVQIRSGTNDLHASLFEYHTDNRLKAKPFFLPLGQNKPKLVDNEFGGTVGGRLKRDRLFYFLSYEGNLHREFASQFATVPTALQKRGDMSESTRPIYDPATGDQQGNNRVALANNLIPASRISPISRKLADLTPLPNLDLLTNNYYGTASYLFDRNRADSKVNWNINEKWTAFGRFSINHYEMNNPQIFGPLGGPEISGAGGNPGVANGNTYSFTGATTYIFNPHLIMDAYFGWTRMDTNVEQPRLDEKLGLDFLGIPGTNGPRRFEGGWPRFQFNTYTTIGHPNDFMPYFRQDPQYQYVANFNWTKTTHEVRFGFDIYFNGMNHTQPEATGALHGAQGGFTFGGGPTQLRGGVAGNQFNSYATFLFGLPTDMGKITMVPDMYTTRQHNYSFYARDRWNATSKLTLSYGLRWEYFPFPTRADRGMEWYDGSVNKMYVCGIG